MPELRWTLLLLGALFIAVLAWSERRKARQSMRTGHEPSIPDVPVLRPQREPTIREPTLREPALTLPEVRAREPSPPQDLPVVHVEDDSLVGLRLDGQRIEEGIAHLDSPQREDSQPVRVGPEWQASSAPDPSVPDLPVLEAAETQQLDEFNTAVFGAAPETADPAAGEQAPLLPGAPTPQHEGAALAQQPSGSAPSVDWPPEEDRRIIALRLVSISPDRFSGRAIRTALVAEGFVHGKFSIFHKPDAQHRAVLSAASLSKPGMFDLETID